MIVLVFWLHSFFQCFHLTVPEASNFASITDFAVGAGAVKDLNGAIGRVAETVGGGGGSSGGGVTTLLFISGFCSKGWATLFS